MRHGYGIYQTPDGSNYKGNWQADLMHGEGILTYSNGKIITGNWVNDRLNGLAKIKRPRKNVVEVIYRDDILIEKKE